MVNLTFSGSIATLTLNDPPRRNALGSAMFEALEHGIAGVAAREDIHVVLLGGAGKAFCAGFDLGAAVEHPPLLGAFILRLSDVNRSLRRMPHVVIAAVQGAAIAGGCALLSACDLVVISTTAQVGYPVHTLGISPAVTIPTLMQAVGPGPARALLMSGALIDGKQAHRLGLASHLAQPHQLDAQARALAHRIAGHGPNALRATKRWLNELDGSLDDNRFDGPALDSARRSAEHEAHDMLQAHWTARSRA